MGRTLSEKLWDAHVVRHGQDGERDLLYIDLHLVHEVTSPQAFDGLRLAGRKVRRPDLTIATEDHNIPTPSPTRSRGHRSRRCVRTLLSSGCRCILWVTRTREWYTSLAPSWGSPSRV